MSTDFARLLPSVAAELLGPPNKRLSSKDEQRYGTNGSLSVDLKTGQWFDHEAKEGGGTLDLIIRQTNCNDRRGAVEWLRAEGFEVEDDRPVKANGHHTAAEPPAARAKIVATYDYVDAAGDLVFQVVRFEPKKFLQRRRPTKGDPADKVKDGWVWSVKGVRQVPYRLPDLVEAIAGDHLVFVAEGEKDVENLAKIGITATCNAMGAGKWPEALNEHFAGASVVILPDNDEAGREHAAMVAAALQGAGAASVRILELPGLAAKGDVSDWIAGGGTAQDLYALVDRAARSPGEASGRLHFGTVWFADTESALEEPEWLVDDVLTRGDMSLLYGPSKSGKSFLATHVALAIARGVDVFDRRVRQGGVVYIAAEGRKGFKKRLRAYRQENGIAAGAELPFVLVPAAVDLFAKEGDIDLLLADLRVVEPEMRRRFAVSTELIVVDTYAAVSPGANENASEDVTRIVKNVQRFKEVASNAHLMIVHHKNASGDRPRGHSSLYAGIDNAIEVACDDYKNRTAKIDKMKDGEDGFSIGFRLQSVTIGARDDGKPITSCVVVPAQAKERTGKGTGLSDQQKIALQALREAVLAHGEAAPASLQLPFGVRVVQIRYWKQEFLKSGFDEEPNESTFRMAFKRIGEALLAKHIIGRDQPFVWIAREPSS